MCASQVTKGNQELQENINTIMNTSLALFKNKNYDGKRLEINAKDIQQKSTSKSFPSG